MLVFLDQAGRKYAAYKAKSIGDAHIVAVSEKLMGLLTAYPEVPFSEADIIDAFDKYDQLLGDMKINPDKYKAKEPRHG